MTDERFKELSVRYYLLKQEDKKLTQEINDLIYIKNSNHGPYPLPDVSPTPLTQVLSQMINDWKEANRVLESYHPDEIINFYEDNPKVSYEEVEHYLGLCHKRKKVRKDLGIVKGSVMRSMYMTGKKYNLK